MGTAHSRLWPPLRRREIDHPIPPGRPQVRRQLMRWLFVLFIALPSLSRTNRPRRYSRDRWGYDPRLSRTTECASCWLQCPETRRAACEAERELGAKATRRLRDLVRARDLDFVYVACSCPAGTQGTLVCNYGRDCGTLKSGGRDVGAILIDEGLAVPFVCGATHCPKTPRPWC
jgi:hypothetical protein